MPTIAGEFEPYTFAPRGGINVLLGHNEPQATRPLDLVNMIPRPDGYVGGAGWAILGDEILTANGIVNHVTGFPRSDESNDTVAVTASKTYKLSAGAWASIQDATNYTLGLLDHATSCWYNDKLYLALPKSGSANAQRVWTGSGNIAALGGAPLNARTNDIFGNRLVYGPVWNTTPTYQPYDVYRSADGDPATHNSEYTRFSQSASFLLRVLRLGQELVCYKQHGIGVLHISGGEQADILPFEPDEIPTDIGLALPEAVASGGNFHFFMGNDDIYLMAGGEVPRPIGGPVATLLFDNFAAGSFALAGYDRRSPQNAGFYLLTNVGLSANDKFLGPNSVATTYTYFYYDIETRSWSRGELTNIPRAVGNYYSRFGFLDAAPISQTAMLMGLDSTNGSSVYELNYTTTTRVGATFTPRILFPVTDFGSIFERKQIAEVWPILKRRTSGTCTISVKYGDAIGGTPTEAISLVFNMDGSSGPRHAGVSGRLIQFEVTFSTNDFYFQGIGFKARVRS